MQGQALFSVCPAFESSEGVPTGLAAVPSQRLTSLDIYSNISQKNFISEPILTFKKWLLCTENKLLKSQVP